MLKSVVCNQLMFSLFFSQVVANIACHVLSTWKEFYCTLVIHLINNPCKTGINVSIADKKYTVLQHVIDDKFSLIKNGINYQTSFFLLVCFFIKSGQKCSS